MDLSSGDNEDMKYELNTSQSMSDDDIGDDEDSRDAALAIEENLLKEEPPSDYPNEFSEKSVKFSDHVDIKEESSYLDHDIILPEASYRQQSSVENQEKKKECLKSRKEIEEEEREKMQKPRKRNLNYSESQMEAAIRDVHAGLTKTQAALKNNVPRGTLVFKLKGRTQLGRKMGPDPFLNKDEKEVLLQWTLATKKAGFYITAQDLKDSVFYFIQLSDRPNPFEGRTRFKYWEAFFRRNPLICFKTPLNFAHLNSTIKAEWTSKWYTHVMDLLSEKDNLHILKDPRRIFHADETAFYLNPTEKITCKKEVDVDYPENEFVSVLLTGNAAGQFAPPLACYNDPTPEISANFPPGWTIGKSKNNWMTGSAFFEYITNVFYPWLVQNKTPLPVILFLDGLNAKLTLHVCQFCETYDIILVALLPSLLQPMEFALSQPLKEAWKQDVDNWVSATNSNLKEADFAKVLNRTLQRVVTPDKLKDGFRRCEIFPWKLPIIEKEIEIEVNKEIQLIKCEDETPKETSFNLSPSTSRNNRVKNRKRKIEEKEQTYIQESKRLFRKHNSFNDVTQLSENSNDAHNLAKENKQSIKKGTAEDRVVLLSSEGSDSEEKLLKSSNVDPSLIVPNTFVLATFTNKQKQNTFKGVCLVQQVKQDSYLVICLRPYDDAKQNFAPIESESTFIKHCQVEAILPAPRFSMINATILYSFDNPVQF